MKLQVRLAAVGVMLRDTELKYDLLYIEHYV